jgi:hypothetical protein
MLLNPQEKTVVDAIVLSLTRFLLRNVKGSPVNRPWAELRPSFEDSIEMVCDPSRAENDAYVMPA